MVTEVVMTVWIRLVCRVMSTYMWAVIVLSVKKWGQTYYMPLNFNAGAWATPTPSSCAHTIHCVRKKCNFIFDYNSRTS